MTNRGKSAAARYGEILAARRRTYKAVSPSGMEWELRPVSVKDFIAGGQLPMGIVTKVAEATAAGSSEQEAMGLLSADEQIEWLVFIQALVQKMAVSPRIVRHAAAEDEIDEVLEEDFAWLTRIAMGGLEAERAGTFRIRPGEASVAGADGPQRRRPRK